MGNRLLYSFFTRKNVASFLSLATLSLSSTTALAQQNVPSSAQPGVVIRSFEDKAREPARLEQPLVVDDSKAPSQGGNAQKVMNLQSVVLDGSTVYKQKDIDALVSNYLGKPASLDDLNTIAQLITRKYRQDGYILSSAILPPQKISNSIVHLKAVEGRITDVKIVGDYTDKFHLINKFADKIKSQGAAKSEDIERYLLLIDDLPGIRARSVLQPSATPNGGELVVTVEQDPFEGSLSFDNRGSEYIGPYRGTAVAAFNSLLGIHDRTTLRGIMSTEPDELRFFDILHEEQVGSEGMRVKTRFAQTRTEPGGDLKSLDLKGDSYLFDVEALYPFHRTRNHNINFIFGFNSLNSETELLGSVTAKDRVRTMRMGWKLDGTDEFAGVNELDLVVTKGLDIFDTTSDGAGRSRANANHSASRLNVNFSRIQDLPADFSVFVSAAGQYSVDPLLASEEFSIGGSEFGRAYDAGEITGDRGVAGLVELRFGRTLQNDYVNSYQAYAFYDAGKVWNHEIAVGEVSSAGATSTGLGVRLNVIHDIYATAEVDFPLSRDVSSEGNDDPRFFFNLTKRF